jgi:hypothetical protein
MYRRQRDYRLPSAFWNIDDRQGMPCGWLDNFWLLQPGPFLRQYMANVGFSLAFRRWQQADRNPGVDLPKMQKHREFGCHLGISFRDGRKSVAEFIVWYLTSSPSRPCRALSTSAPRAGGLSGGDWFRHHTGERCGRTSPAPRSSIPHEAARRVGCPSFIAFTALSRKKALIVEPISRTWRDAHRTHRTAASR